MYGNDMGTLKLYRQRDSNDYAGTHTDVWSIAGDQGNVWKQVSVDVDLSTSSEMVRETCNVFKYELYIQVYIYNWQ